MKDVIQEIVEFPFPRIFSPEKVQHLFLFYQKQSLEVCALEAAFHEHLKTAAFVDAVGLGLSTVQCQEADWWQPENYRNNFPQFETFVKSLEKWHFEAVLVVWSFAVWKASQLVRIRQLPQGTCL